MNTYEIWVDLAPDAQDLEFVDAVRRYLDHIASSGNLASYRIRRRKFGFGPEVLGEFNISIEFEDLAQMDRAFGLAAARDEEIEPMHAAVYEKVRNFRSALYRDFPDPVRIRSD